MKKFIKIVFFVVVGIGIAVFFANGGVEGMAEQNLQEIENKVAQDAVQQYKIAKDAGSEMDAYVAAGLAKAAFLQANDADNYKVWVAIEKQHANNLGLE